MKKFKLTKVIASALIVASVLVLNPIGASAVVKGPGSINPTWQSKNGTYYYLYADGNVGPTGWVKSGSSWYYVKEDGLAFKGWLQDGKNWYYTYKGGDMAANTIIDGHYLGWDGALTQTPCNSLALSDSFDSTTQGTFASMASLMGIAEANPTYETVSAAQTAFANIHLTHYDLIAYYTIGSNSNNPFDNAFERLIEVTFKLSDTDRDTLLIKFEQQLTDELYNLANEGFNSFYRDYIRYFPCLYVPEIQDEMSKIVVVANNVTELQYIGRDPNAKDRRYWK